jgi:hypothetical protein
MSAGSNPQKGKLGSVGSNPTNTSPLINAQSLQTMSSQDKQLVHDLSHIIPPGHTPYGDWARRVRNILVARGIDLESPIFSQFVVPIIMARLPTYLGSLLPTGNAKLILDYLDDIFKGDSRLSDAYRLGRPIEQRPSIANLMLVDELLNSDDPPPTREAAEHQAWSIIKSGLPTSMLDAITFVKIRGKPDTEQWSVLDKVWRNRMEQGKPVEFASTSAHIVSQPSVMIQESVDQMHKRSNSVDANSKMLEAITEQTKQVKKLSKVCSTFTDNFRGNRNSSLDNNRRNNQGGYRGQGGNRRNGGPNDSGNRRPPRLYKLQTESDGDIYVCYAHFKFGNNAWSCAEGCYYKGRPLAPNGQAAPSA